MVLGRLVVWIPGISLSKGFCLLRGIQDSDMFLILWKEEKKHGNLRAAGQCQSFGNCRR